MKFIDVEQRDRPASGMIELRAGIAGGGEPHLVGHAAVFDTETTIAGLFVERLAKGCFANTLMKDNIAALFNHNADYLLGRTASKTLVLGEDAKGLWFDLALPDTTAGRDVLASVKRLDLSGMSFAFQSIKEVWDDSGDLPTRTIQELDLFEVSCVVNPQYTTTDVSIRASKTGPFREIAPASIIAARQRMKAGLLQREGHRVIH